MSVQDGYDVATGPDEFVEASGRRRLRVNVRAATSHSRALVDICGVEREVAGAEATDGKTSPPPAGCPCSSGF